MSDERAESEEEKGREERKEERTSHIRGVDSSVREGDGDFDRSDGFGFEGSRPGSVAYLTTCSQVEEGGFDGGEVDGDVGC